MGINVMQTNQEKTGLLRSGATLQVFGIGMSVWFVMDYWTQVRGDIML